MPRPEGIAQRDPNVLAAVAALCVAVISAIIASVLAWVLLTPSQKNAAIHDFEIIVPAAVVVLIGIFFAVRRSIRSAARKRSTLGMASRVGDAEVSTTEITGVARSTGVEASGKQVGTLVTDEVPSGTRVSGTAETTGNVSGEQYGTVYRPSERRGNQESPSDQQGPFE